MTRNRQCVLQGPLKAKASADRHKKLHSIKVDMVRILTVMASERSSVEFLLSRSSWDDSRVFQLTSRRHRKTTLIPRVRRRSFSLCLDLLSLMVLMDLLTCGGQLRRDLSGPRLCDSAGCHHRGCGCLRRIGGWC